MASTMRFDRWEDTNGNSVNMTQLSGGSGLVPVIPTSIVVGSGFSSVSVNGTVTFSGASAISLNGVFTSAYSSYRLVFAGLTASSGSSSFQFRLRKSGADAQSNYQAGGLYTGHTQTSVFAWGLNNGAEMPMTDISSANNSVSGIVDMHNPQVNAMTGFQSNFNSLSGGTYYMECRNGAHVTIDQYDGISFLPNNVNTLSGTIKVYGYR